jgi:hypothetical protein
MANNVKDNVFKLYNWFKDAHDQMNATSQLSGPSNNQSEPINPSLIARADAFKQR